MSRDALCVLFWPESDTERARNALNQTLFGIRRELRQSEAVLGTGELRLNPTALTSDVGDFSAALAENQLERAVTLYKGPFLDGVHLTGASEFERWAEGERDRFARLAANALRRLGREADVRGDHELAAEWWRRLATLEPTSSPVAFALMKALAAVGDVAGALRHAAAHEAILRTEFDAPPDPAITAFAAQLRQPAHMPAASAAPGAATPSLIMEVTPRVPGHLREDDAHSKTVTTPGALLPVTTSPRSRSRNSRRQLIAVLLGLVLPAAALAAYWARSLLEHHATAPVLGRVVAVFPFAAAAAPEYAYLREGLAEVLSAGLDGAGEIRTIAPSAVLGQLGADSARPVSPQRGSALAARLGANLFVLGEVTALGERLHVTAALYDGGHRVISRAESNGSASELALLVDRLTARLVADMSGARDTQLIRTAALTTQSLPALKAYLDGERAFRIRRYADAADGFRRAIAADTGFGLAYYRLSIAEEWASAADEGRGAAEGAVRHMSRLPMRERALLEARLALLRGGLDEAERRYRIIVSLYPDEAQAWSQLGELAFHYGPLRGRPVSSARLPFERVLRFHSDDNEALSHLRLLAAFEGRGELVDSLTQRLVARAGSTPDDAAIAFRAFATGDSAAQGRALASLANASDEAVFTLARSVTVYSRNLTGAQQIAGILSEGSRAAKYRVYGFVLSAEIELARGRWRAAETALGPHPGLDPAWGAELQAIFGSMPFLDRSREELRALRSQLGSRHRRPNKPYDDLLLGVDTRLDPYALALLSARLGDIPSLQRHGAKLASAHAPDAFTAATYHALTATVRAEMKAAENDVPGALTALDSGWLELKIGHLLNLLGTQTYERYRRGELLRAMSRDDEAISWWVTIAQASPFEVPFLAPAELRQAEIYDQRGDTTHAVAHYRRFIGLWRECDPDLRPRVALAEARLRALGVPRVP